MKLKMESNREEIKDMADVTNVTVVVLVLLVCLMELLGGRIVKKSTH